MADKHSSFVASDRLQVIIPYSDYEKVVQMAMKIEEMEKQYQRMEEQYSAIRYMFSECLEAIQEIRKFVSD